MCEFNAYSKTALDDLNLLARVVRSVRARPRAVPVWDGECSFEGERHREYLFS
jgi:hypothetical protein